MERALDEWADLLKSRDRPNVRNPKQTCHSLAVMAALFRLMGKVTSAHVDTLLLWQPWCSFYVFIITVIKVVTTIIPHNAVNSTDIFIDPNCLYGGLFSYRLCLMSLSLHFGKY